MKRGYGNKKKAFLECKRIVVYIIIFFLIYCKINKKKYFFASFEDRAPGFQTFPPIPKKKYHPYLYIEMKIGQEII